MPKILIQNLANKEFDAVGNKTLLQHFQHHRQDWLQSCGGKGRCTTCKVVVLEGLNNLSPMSSAELAYARQGALKGAERLSCQALVHGDIIVRVPQDCKLPHVHYSD